MLMKTHNPRILHLRQMLDLEQRRSTLESELSKVGEELHRLRQHLLAERSAPLPTLVTDGEWTLDRDRGNLQPSPRKRGARGALTAQILHELKTAGPSGISVSQIAERTGRKYANIYIWFATTGKKNPNVQKAGPALFKLAA